MSTLALFLPPVVVMAAPTFSLWHKGPMIRAQYHLKNPGLKAHALAGCHEGGKLA
jgi:hypothetical protein